ncbi:hypothetical protein [Streptomyces sp. cf386]|uniref:hypothetical protein n=1 Tax=Streptomyces sp. cf386 TaxID=1761904 RepID=UPI00210B536F|nr:hypothetical protein [Streptomyces sp. cf386]
MLRAGPAPDGVVRSRTAVPVAQVAYKVRPAGELARLLHRHDLGLDLFKLRSGAPEGLRGVVGVLGAVGDLLADHLRPRPEQIRTLSFPVGEDVLNSGVKVRLDPVSSDEVLTEGRPGLCHRLHGFRIGVSDHVFHLVHVEIDPEWRGVLCRHALIRFDILEVVDVLAAHVYSPLAST